MIITRISSRVMNVRVLSLSRLKDVAYHRVTPRIHGGNSSALCLVASRCISQSAVRLAGHSHWKNIKHVKGANDAKKSALCIRIGRDIKTAIKLNGSSNPKDNADLARILAYARSENIGNDTVDRAIASAVSSKNKPTESVTLECSGPGGAMMILELASATMSRTRMDMKAIFKKHVASLVDGGGILYQFEQKTMITVKKEGEKTSDLNKAEEVAIEIGAEEVEEGDFPGEIVFVCEPMVAGRGSKELGKLGYNVTDTVTEYIPKKVIELSKEAADELRSLISKLEEHPDFVNIYLNCVI